MRLLFVIENDQPHASGGGYYAPFRFAEFLARRGHDVLIYAVHDLGWVAPSDHLLLRFRPSVPRTGRLWRRIDRALSAACGRLILEKQARAFRPDWVLGVFKESAIRAAGIGRRVGARVANFVYECPPWLVAVLGEETCRRQADAYTLDLWERTRRAYLESDLLFPNSELARRWMSRWLDGREVGEPIHPGIDPATMPLEGAGGARPDTGRGRVLYVGRLAPAKNVDRLIEACLGLDPAPVLHICGEGPEAGRLAALAGGRDEVVFHGFLDDRDLWAQYRAADLVVSPSSFEGFGMPPMQALYFGKPCLVSDLEIYRSVYGDLLEYAPAGDVGALSAAIRRLLADPGYRRRRGQEGRRQVLERFTWSEAARRLEVALAGAVPARPAAAPGDQVP